MNARSLAAEHVDLRLVFGRACVLGMPALRDAEAFAEWTGEAAPAYARRDAPKRGDGERVGYCYHLFAWIESKRIPIEARDLRLLTAAELRTAQIAACDFVDEITARNGAAPLDVDPNWPRAFAPLSARRDAGRIELRSWRDAYNRIRRGEGGDA